MNFFVDNNISPAIANALSSLSQREGVKVVPLREKFLPSVEDRVWLESLGKERNWVILSGDISITRKPHEHLAWQQCGLTAFFLPEGLDGHSLLGSIVEARQMVANDHRNSQAFRDGTLIFGTSQRK